MRIDAHHHIWDLSVRDQPWTRDIPGLHRSFGFAELAPHLAAEGIDQTVVVQTVATPDETPELLASARTEPMVGGVVGWVDLEAPDVADRLASLQELPGGDRLVGIRHQVQEEKDLRWLCRSNVMRGLAQVAEAGLSYDLLIIPRQFPAAIEIVAELPQLRFILDHGGKPPIAAGGYRNWYEQISALAELPNVAVKASGLVTEADHDHWTRADIEPYLRTMITEFGPDRVMFGSDWPVCTVAGGYRAVTELLQQTIDDLSVPEQESIFAGTARHWYGLPDQSERAWAGVQSDNDRPAGRMHGTQSWNPPSGDPFRPGHGDGSAVSEKDRA
jgi:L-fuconolactonase